MKRIVVNGGIPLHGEITVSGSKNAALPIIFACILTNGVSEIEDLPNIGDVRVALDLLRSFGALIESHGRITFIDTRELSYTSPDLCLVEKIRASTYLLGSCLSRFGRCPIMSFGGCNFSSRPIDMHIAACIALGARMDNETLSCDRLKGGIIEFDKASVGATVNAILLSASAEGETFIRGCAVEPHIDALISFLNSCGASVVRQGRDVRIVGKELHGGKIRVIGDMIEAGSYIAIGLMTGGNIKLLNTPVADMKAVLHSLSEMGVEISFLNHSLEASLSESRFLSITASPYPGFPTDLQPIMAPLLARNSGGEIIEEVWRDRFGYLKTLSAFGIGSTVDRNCAQIYHSVIHNAIVTVPDLRGGMAALMCALSSKGRSEIYSAETILRGYENLEEKLRAVGAEIEIENI